MMVNFCQCKLAAGYALLEGRGGPARLMLLKAAVAVRWVLEDDETFRCGGGARV